MGITALLRWQWDGYASFHQDRRNLLLHIVVVPLFLIGNIAIVTGLILGTYGMAIAGLVACIVSLAVQGRGHRIEAVPPVPFDGPANAVARLLLEQWITFPRFVLSGGWLANLRRTAGA